MKVVFSPRALADLRLIADYLDVRSPKGASAVIAGSSGTPRSLRLITPLKLAVDAGMAMAMMHLCTLAATRAHTARRIIGRAA